MKNKWKRSFILNLALCQKTIINIKLNKIMLPNNLKMTMMIMNRNNKKKIKNLNGIIHS